MNNLVQLVNALRALSDEQEWFEFKHNNYDPDTIGTDISALANSATLHGRDKAYMIWGIHNEKHAVIGTDYDLKSLKRGGQEIDSYLRNLLSKNADFEYKPIEMQTEDGRTVRVGVITILPARALPVTYKQFAYIRVGSYTKPISEYPRLYEKLMDRLRGFNFETQPAASHLTLSDALAQLSTGTYYDQLKKPTPLNPDTIAHDFTEDALLTKEDNGLYSITNLGALLLAKRLSSFKHLERKALRIVQHQGTNRMQMLKDETFDEGYAVSLDKAEQYLKALLPSREVIDGATRRVVYQFPMLAIREAAANMCIHQDLAVGGSSLLIEVFENRVELTNPGTPLVEVKRIVDNPPRSRNEKLSALMRRFKLCEEAGSGWDKMVTECDEMNLPAPKITVYEVNTKVTIFSKVEFNHLSIDDKLWALYLHACVGYVQGTFMTNSSLRVRFGLAPTRISGISRLIKQALEQNLIKPLHSDAPPKLMQYIPIWA